MQVVGRRRRWAALLAALVAAGCGGSGATTSGLPTGALAARFTGARPCRDIPGFTCEVLTVPLDHGGGATGTLRLAVGVQNATAAPRGVLLFLTGGPGQSGVPFIPRIRLHLGALLDGYRLVMFDERGTGGGALRCPALQAAAGSSDLVVTRPGVVAACARALGPDRRYFTTAETVADIERLRSALGVPRLTVDGVSYGSYVAERYALAHPQHVARLVLDSIVPQQGADPLYLASIAATARVLRSACGQARCGYDPAQDLAAVVRMHHDGPALLNAIVAESIVAPAFPHVLAALHAGAHGDMGPINGFLAAVRAGEEIPAAALSQGLHESTLCVELAPPWNPEASPQQRERQLAAAAARLPAASVYPYDRATAADNGIGRGCAQWPATTAPAVADGNPGRPLPDVPVLILAGTHDLSTPLVWARAEARDAPRGQLVIVPGAGHSVQTKAGGDPAVRRALAGFLDG